MNDKTGEAILSTEPTEQPRKALRFAKAFEEDICKQRSFRSNNDVRTEPVFAYDRRTQNPCRRSGFEFSHNL